MRECRDDERRNNIAYCTCVQPDESRQRTARMRYIESTQYQSNMKTHYFQIEHNTPDQGAAKVIIQLRYFRECT